MGDKDKSKEQLLAELDALRARVATLEQAVVDRNRVEQALHEAEGRFRTVIDQAPFSIIIYNPDGSVNYGNPAAVRLFGLSREQYEEVAQFYNILQDEQMHQLGLMPYIKQAFAGLPARTPEVKFTRMPVVEEENPPQPAIDISSFIFPLKDSDQRVIQVIVFMLDITERKRVEAEREALIVQLEAKNTELESRTQELDAFAHTVAHGLKNPLMIITGSAELLGDDLPPSCENEVRQSLEAIETSGHKMARIIDDLLLLAEAQTAADIRMETLDMDIILAWVRYRLEPLMQTHRVEIKTPEHWPAAQGYGPWVEEVWNNYLSNAILYGGQSPCIEVGAEARGAGMVRFWVRDNGPGITLEEVPRLFTPFTRLGQARTGGSGLGLSIVRRIVERMGGEVGVESQVGQGSLFSFTLPKAG